VRLVDLNADGAADLIAAETPFGVPKQTSVTINPGNGMFPSDPTTIYPQHGVLELSTLSGKSDVDLLFARSDGISRLRNDGSGGFAAFSEDVKIDNDAGPLAVATGDLDNDGVAEVIVGGLREVKVIALRNNKWFRVPVYSANINVIGARLDPASNTDLLVRSGDTLFHFLNDGKATFSVHSYPALEPPQHAKQVLAVDNVRGAGAPDVVTVTSFNQLQVFENRGPVCKGSRP
jgi:hypothetical protein